MIYNISIAIYIDTVSLKRYNIITDTVSLLIERRFSVVKKNIGSQLALYPMPVTVIGAMGSNGKPTWTLVAHVGIIGHNMILISLASAHFINGLIKESNKLSVSLVNEAMLPEADFSGSVSGAKTDKSNLFEYELGSAGTPVIKKAPLTMECTITDIYNTPNFESFICTIDNTYVEESCLNSDGKIDYEAIKPVLFDFPVYEYIRTGDVIGKCLSFKKEYEK